MNITPILKELQGLFPTAVINAEFMKGYISWHLELNPAISEKEHDEAMPRIREIFGTSLMERYTEETGRDFYIYQRTS